MRWRENGGDGLGDFGFCYDSFGFDAFDASGFTAKAVDAIKFALNNQRNDSNTIVLQR